MLKRILFLLLKLAGAFMVLLLILFVGMYLNASGEYSVPKTVAFDSSLPSITVDGVTFHVNTFGDSTKPVAIVLHGGPGNDFAHLLPLKDLSKDFFVVFYDQRGSGQSPRVPNEELTLENALADVGRVAAYYSPERPVHLIGHSWGGMLATGFTARNPERVARVVIADPGMLNTEMASKFLETFQIKPSMALFKVVLRAYFESLHIKQEDGHERKDYLFQRIAMSDLPDNPMKNYFCEGDITSAHLPIVRLGAANSMEIQKGGMVDGEFQIDLISGIENYKDTVLFFTGACNSVTGEEFQIGHVALFPRVRFEVVPDAGHTMFGERPEYCNTLIAEYLNGYMYNLLGKALAKKENDEPYVIGMTLNQLKKEFYFVEKARERKQPSTFSKSSELFDFGNNKMTPKYKGILYQIGDMNLYLDVVDSVVVHAYRVSG